MLVVWIKNGKVGNNWGAPKGIKRIGGMVDYIVEWLNGVAKWCWLWNCVGNGVVLGVGTVAKLNGVGSERGRDPGLNHVSKTIFVRFFGVSTSSIFNRFLDYTWANCLDPRLLEQRDNRISVLWKGIFTYLITYFLESI